MPAKYRIKEYAAPAYYHIYNRGLDGRVIFSDEQDYQKFIDLVRGYVNPKAEEADERFKRDKPSIAAKKESMRLVGEVEVAAYCLLPNHFHLLVRQTVPDGITKLMRRMTTGYVMYFNKKYRRHGPLWENVYRAVKVPGEGEELLEQVVALSVYLHIHPVARTAKRFGPVITVTSGRPEEYVYSSVSQYLGVNKDVWINVILNNIKPLDYAKRLGQPPEAVTRSLVTPVFE